MGISTFRGKQMEEHPIKVDEKALLERQEENRDARGSPQPRKERKPRKKVSPMRIAMEFRNTEFKRSCEAEQ